MSGPKRLSYKNRQGQIKRRLKERISYLKAQLRKAEAQLDSLKQRGATA